MSITMQTDQAEIESTQTKVYEFLQNHKDMANEDILKKYQQTIKSNSIKTILYHFVEFMRSRGDEIVIEALTKKKDKSITQIRKEFQSFIKAKKLNQQTFLALFNSERFSTHLEYYLNYYSIDIILANNMKDYEYHIICLAFFQRCFAYKNLTDHIKTYKKNNSPF